MGNRRSTCYLSLGAAMLVLSTAWPAHAGLIEIKFATNAVTNVNPGNAAWVAALAGLGITPGGISGRLFYESTTAGGAITSPANTQTYDGAVDSLSFSVANWFSQSLTNIGLNGDISVQDNGTTQFDQDRIQVAVTCTPGINTGSVCTSQSYNFNYAFTDGAGITWALDAFTLLLQESTAVPNPVSGTSLPTRDEWESSQWVTERIDLRFNPSNSTTGNVSERGAISFLAVPEPGTMALVGLGLLGLGRMRRRA